MADFVHCNSCYKQPSAQGDNTYFLTSCYHILCQGCADFTPGGEPISCTVCKREVKAVEINSAPKKLIAEKLALLKRKYDFQQTLVNSLLSHIKKIRKSEVKKELADLREWINVAEVKMKENEQEKASLNQS
ncbi:unnamed protein product [Haemonchus placei]|uniref:RING-type domain-containing protein n=1 Tax=Haemonchus placei TaxID=6290 RepID=A0A0N4W3A0_HAEPC|nr:unnamed protein product [Haemonchus placei]